MRVVHGALVRAQQPLLGQRGDAVDGGQQLAGILAAGAGGPLAGPLVVVAEVIQPAVALPSVRDNPRVRLDVTGHEGMQRGSGRAIQDRHPAPADPFGFLTSTAMPLSSFLPLGKRSFADKIISGRRRQARSTKPKTECKQ
jgi:hypothetical protein